MSVLNMRGVDPELAGRIRRAAAARGLTPQVYFARLVALHEDLRQGCTVETDLSGAINCYIYATLCNHGLEEVKT